MAGIDYNQLTGPQRKVLREALLDVFRRARDLDQFLQDYDYDPLEHLVEDGPFSHQMFELIGVFRSRGKLSAFVPQVRAEYPDAPAMRELDERLAMAGAAVEQQRVAAGLKAQGFGLERIVRDGGFADLNLWAAQLVAAGRRVCRISYPVRAGVLRGSGFLVAGDLLLTNFHVIEALLATPETVPDVRMQFDYAEGEDGVAGGEKFRLHDNWHIASSRYSAADLVLDGGLPTANELDFALVRLAKAAGELGDPSAPASKRGWISLPGPLANGVYVLQHPEGKPLKLSVGVVKPAVTSLRLRYDADTESGSSGGLVLNQQLQPIALHHAGDPAAAVRATYNQGIPLSAIRAALEANPAVPRFWGTVSGANE
jgi:hypothetical protein